MVFHHFADVSEKKKQVWGFKKHKSLGLTYDQVYRIYSNIRIHLSLKTNKSVKFPFVKENALLTRIVLYLSLRAFFPHVALHEDHSVHSLITHRTFGKCFAGWCIEWLSVSRPGGNRWAITENKLKLKFVNNRTIDF